MTHIRRIALLGALIAALVALGACGKDKTDIVVATDVNVSTNASPTALAALPQDVEATSLTIKQAQFDTDVVKLQENSPSIINITNDDATAYTVTIEGLVNQTDVPPSQITKLSFTTPSAHSYTLQLMGQGSPTPVDTVQVIVQAAGGTSP